MEPIIQVKNLVKSFDTDDGVLHAVNDVSFNINKGEIFGIIGLSGAGKSTLVRCLNLLEKPSSGSVVVQGQDLMSLSEKDLRQARRKIGMIFQHFNLLMQISVVKNVMFPMEIAGVPKAEAKKKALEYLKIVGLEAKANAFPAQLSGGQKQRVAIARVLASNPEILLCDEATSALDPETTKSILNLIKDINRKYNITVVVITHEMSVIQEICDQCIVLENGKLVEQNNVEELFRHPKTSAAKRLIFSASKTVKEMSNGKLVRVTFSEVAAGEPIVGNMILEFKTPVSILQSEITDLNGKSNGQMLLRLPDDEDKANKMIAYLQKKAEVTVEEVVHE
ncbi:MAG: ATP-binding cassette domain-containing protein [Erysipelotrichaceae bacterium]|nr:ATP-binding cassette domain-containing protein [Erysipelotrichaceae bacterium]